jgi:bacterioferritin
MSATTKRMTTVPSFAASRKLRRMARSGLEPEAVTEPYRGDRTAMLQFLNEALATQLVCVLRYRRHHFMARGFAAKRIAEEFLVHADEELAHADLIADRIVQLGGEPDFAPGTLCERSHSQYVPANTIAIDSYRGQIEFLGESDRTTRRMLEGILGVQEAHADELVELLEDSGVE